MLIQGVCGTEREPGGLGLAGLSQAGAIPTCSLLPLLSQTPNSSLGQPRLSLIPPPVKLLVGFVFHEERGWFCPSTQVLSQRGASILAGRCWPVPKDTRDVAQPQPSHVTKAMTHLGDTIWVLGLLKESAEGGSGHSRHEEGGSNGSPSGTHWNEPGPVEGVPTHGQGVELGDL